MDDKPTPPADVITESRATLHEMNHDFRQHNPTRIRCNRSGKRERKRVGEKEKMKKKTKSSLKPEQSLIG